MPQATITVIDKDFGVYIYTSGNHLEDLLYKGYRTVSEHGLVVGDKIEVQRQTNNPYPVFVKRISQ